MPTCSHLDQITAEAPDLTRPTGCQECLESGTIWVHLRRCLSCGHIGCCDSSTNQHASRHYEATGHPLIVSHQPGENWGWCYPERLFLDFDR